MMTGLIDGNNFFVSCERVFDPSLEGKPVAVLSNNDGCCISRSNEFKALQIPMGTPYFQLKDRIRPYGLVLKSSNYALYADLSRRIITLLHDFAQDVEQYSIDEAFIHLALPGNMDYHAYGEKIRRTILQCVGIPCGVGFAPTKTLAKIANHIAKKSPSGVFVMPQDPMKILERIPVEEVWGVGRRLALKLNHRGIRTAAQLAQCDHLLLRKQFSILLEKTALELRSIRAITEEDPDQLHKSISCSRSFGIPVTEFDHLAESVATYTAKAAEKLRKEAQCASGVNVYFQYYNGRGDGKMQNIAVSSLTIHFDHPTANTAEMLSSITPSLHRIYHHGRKYKKSGVIFFGLESSVLKSADLFEDTEKLKKEEHLSSVIDKVNAKFGRGTLFHLSEGISKPWSMKRELLSPAYTTSWKDIPLVK